MLALAAFINQVIALLFFQKWKYHIGNDRQRAAKKLCQLLRGKTEGDIIPLFNNLIPRLCDNGSGIP